MRTLTPLCFVIALLLALVGCGSGSQTPSLSKATGSATFTVTWPNPSRLIPKASASIVVQILNGSTQIASQTLARPASGGTATATFPLLPPGTLTAKATAYPQANGSGVAQATATLLLTL